MEENFEPLLVDGVIILSDELPPVFTITAEVLRALVERSNEGSRLKTENERLRAKLKELEVSRDIEDEDTRREAGQFVVGYEEEA